MFGMIRAGHPSPDGRQRWSAHYCGVCGALGRHHGQSARLLLNGDAVLLSLLCEAQCGTPFPTVIHRCAFRGFRPTPVISADTPGARFGAMVSVLMAASKIRDHLADGDSFVRRFPRLFKRLADRWYGSAAKRGRALGFDAAAVDERMREQIKVEGEAGRDFPAYAAPVEAATGLICGHTAALSGVPANRPALEDVGRLFGRMLYLLDGYRDYGRDVERRAFNPLAASLPEAHIPETARSIFDLAMDALIRTFDRLALVRTEPVRSLFLEAVPAIGHRVLSRPLVEAATDERGRSDRKGRRVSSRQSGCDCCDCCDLGDSWCDDCGCDLFACTGCMCCQSCDCGG